jgi:histidinol-phosphate phosphatase family protein
MPDIKIDSSWSLFLDRDGVINERNFEGYITSKSDFKFLPKVIEGLKVLSKQFSRIIVVTNQQGIAKGIMTEETLGEIHTFMIDALKIEGIHIDNVSFASNFKGAEMDRRKPKSSMAFEAQTTFPEIDFKKSIMVGDTDSDLKFGMNLGMTTVLITSLEKVSVEPNIKVNNFKELADVLQF